MAARWNIDIHYITGRPSEHGKIEEIGDLDQHIEGGPDWNEIGAIVLTLDRRTWPTWKPDQ